MEESDISKFIEKGAQIMSTDRPDVWDYDSAKQTLMQWVMETASMAREYPNDDPVPTYIGTACFTLYRFIEDEDDGEDTISYELKRDVVDYREFIGEPEGEDTLFTDWTVTGELIHG